MSEANLLIECRDARTWPRAARESYCTGETITTSCNEEETVAAKSAVNCFLPSDHVQS